MPWTERQRCRFQPYADGDGRPSPLYIDLAEKPPDIVDKQASWSAVLNNWKNVSWTEASALADELNAKIDLFCDNTRPLVKIPSYRPIGLTRIMHHGLADVAQVGDLA